MHAILTLRADGPVSCRVVKCSWTQIHICQTDYHFHPTLGETSTPWESLGSPMSRPLVVRSLSFSVGELPAPVLRLLAEFRLIVNESIRIALREDVRSRFRLAKVAYAVLSAEHDVHKQYIPSAFEVALGVLKVHRRRAR